LGTIADENTGYSSVYGASSDGGVLVGSADNNNGDEEAFIWHRGDQKIRGLEPLKRIILAFLRLSRSPLTEKSLQAQLQRIMMIYKLLFGTQEMKD
jgi:uncharacterized membrane protein